MFSEIMSKIGTTLNGLTGSGKPLQVVYNYPVDDISGYPCAIYYPVAFDNTFLTNAEDMKGCKFKIFIVMETKIEGVSGAYTLMGTVLDTVIGEFDEKWSQGSIEGHRVWWKISNGDWALSNTKTGLVLSAELDLIANLITND
jgi:hypothetical protein